MAIADERVSRRRLLKRAGIGAAAVGAASMVTASAASAQGDALCIEEGGCQVCGTYSGCDDPGFPCCVCGITAEGCCVCVGNWFCDDVLNCSSSSQCPPGWDCVVGSCCGRGQCVPHCGVLSHHSVCVNGAASPFAGGPTGVGVGAQGGHGGHQEEAPAHGGHGGHQ